MCAGLISSAHTLQMWGKQSHPGAGQITQSKPRVERRPFQHTHCPLLTGTDRKSCDCNHILHDNHNCGNVCDSYVQMLTAWMSFTMDPVLKTLSSVITQTPTKNLQESLWGVKAGRHLDYRARRDHLLLYNREKKIALPKNNSITWYSSRQTPLY